jgi:hypothetical protein
MRHSSPETKPHFQLGLLEQVRQNLEKENENVYSKGKVYIFMTVSPQPAQKRKLPSLNER